jgi:hypothetical protein
VLDRKTELCWYRGAEFYGRSIVIPWLPIWTILGNEQCTCIFFFFLKNEKLKKINCKSCIQTPFLK